MTLATRPGVRNSPQPRYWGPVVASRTVTIGVVLLAVLGLFELAYSFLAGVPGDQMAFGIVVGLGTLVALGLWASGRGPRIAMWVAVVLIGVTAIAALASFFVPGIPVGLTSCRRCSSSLRSLRSCSSGASSEGDVRAPTPVSGSSEAAEQLAAPPGPQASPRPPRWRAKIASAARAIVNEVLRIDGLVALVRKDEVADVDPARPERSTT